jgi:acyl-CoA thioesterase-2
MTEPRSDWNVLLTLVGVAPIDDRRARGETGPAGAERGGLFGGQMIAQSLAACAHTVPAGSVPDSMHANLLRGGRAGDPVEFHVDRVRDGRNLQHREVRGYQGDDLIVQATVVSALPIRGLDWQEPTAPPVGPPHRYPDGPMVWAEGLGRGVFEVAHPMPDGDTDRLRSSLDDPTQPSAHPLWVRCAVDLPEDPWLHGAIRAFWSDFGMNWAARSIHNLLAPEPVTSVSATHSIWFHRPTPTGEWHLLDVHARSIFSNQVFVQAALFDSGGRISMSINQGVFVRGAALDGSRGAPRPA